MHQMRRSVASVLDGRYEVMPWFRKRWAVLTTIHYCQMRLQFCTLASTNLILGHLWRMDSAQTEMAAKFQQVLTMLQKGQVRQRSRSLSMHSQVEPVGFNSQTTRVGTIHACRFILMGIILGRGQYKHIHCHLLDIIP